MQFQSGGPAGLDDLLQVGFRELGQRRLQELLERCIVLKVDPDEHASLARHFNVVGLPDIRLITSQGAEAAQLLDFTPPNKFQAALSDVLADETDGD